MARIPHIAFILIAAVGLAAIDGAVVAQPKDKDRKEQKVKEQKHQNGKNAYLNPGGNRQPENDRRIDQSRTGIGGVVKPAVGSRGVLRHRNVI